MRLTVSPPGAFDYEFGALDNLDNPFTKSYTNLVYSTFGAKAPGLLLRTNLFRHLPGWFIRSIFEMGSGPGLQKARENREHAHRVARELIGQKRQEMAVGKSEKDILSSLGAFHRVPLLRRLISGWSLYSQSKRCPGRTVEVARR